MRTKFASQVTRNNLTQRAWLGIVFFGLSLSGVCRRPVGPQKLNERTQDARAEHIKFSILSRSTALTMTACASSSAGCSSCPQSIPTSGPQCHEDIEDLSCQLREIERSREQMQARLDALSGSSPKQRLRSSDWFRNYQNPALSALYVERFLNFGLTTKELTSGRPVIGIAQSGSDIAPCNRYHLELSKRVADGIRSAGGIPLEFPQYPIQESVRRPTATLDRNLLYLTLVEILHSYPLDGVVLLTGCDKTTPACIMAAATVDIPALCMNVGPMLDGHANTACDLVGAGTVLWRARELQAGGLLKNEEMVDYLAQGTPSAGHCNTMGTASTMNALAEALGMALPGSAAIPAPYRRRGQCAYETGEAIVEMVQSDRRPSQILTRAAFENAIMVNSAIGGSTNAPIHLNAIAKHAGVELSLDDWDVIGSSIPCIVNVQPAGEKLCEEYFRAGGLSAVVAELLANGKLHADALACNGRTIGQNAGSLTWDRDTIKPYDVPLATQGGFIHLKGNLFDSGIMKLSVISPDFRKRYLSDLHCPDAFEGKVVVFDGPEDFHHRIADTDFAATIDEHSILVMRGAGPIGYPGAAEVVNMHPPAHLITRGITSLPTIGDGRQSGTSYAPSILNVSPEAADGGNLAILETGDRLRVDLRRRAVELLVDASAIAERWTALKSKGGFKIPASQTPWQALYREKTGPLSEGMILKNATDFQRITSQHPVPRHNH